MSAIMTSVCIFIITLVSVDSERYGALWLNAPTLLAFILILIYNDRMAINNDGIFIFKGKNNVVLYKWDNIMHLRKTRRCGSKSIEVVLNSDATENSNNSIQERFYFESTIRSRRALEKYCKVPIQKSTLLCGLKREKRS